MVKVSIIGSGNVAQHLISAFSTASGIELIQAFSRNRENLAHLLDPNQITDDFNALTDADLYIIAVTDDAITEVSQQLPFKGQLVAHTSGSLSINILDDRTAKPFFIRCRRSQKQTRQFREIPICLESENAEDFKTLETVAHAISDSVFPIDSVQRKAMHVSAVFVNNFVNHLFKIGNDICNEHQIPFDILKPLIRETAQKVMVLDPKAAQTGPAKRRDQKTIAAHLELLSDPNQRNIYQILTQSIQDEQRL
jgi:predicted short-subunit dehydrogenase-like oxidoreductase (DUF2520 family)